jgi:hypothetical protein
VRSVYGCSLGTNEDDCGSSSDQDVSDGAE